MFISVLYILYFIEKVLNFHCVCFMLFISIKIYRLLSGNVVRLLALIRSDLVYRGLIRVSGRTFLN
ncbi:hypothetical protein Sjap_009878 [Stephania japonica]|uniref:Uncharacterized protein n=1 Tax=Stephania japonica TaxID=461633 RepID=A0AAP0JAH8_9MAGN